MPLGYARFLLETGHEEEAATLLDEARRVAERELPPDSPELARFLSPKSDLER